MPLSTLPSQQQQQPLWRSRSSKRAASQSAAAKQRMWMAAAAQASGAAAPAAQQQVAAASAPPPSPFLRSHLLKLAPYTPIEPFEILSAKLGRRPEEIVKLDANENPYGPPPEVRWFRPVPRARVHVLQSQRTVPMHCPALSLMLGGVQQRLPRATGCSFVAVARKRADGSARPALVPRRAFPGAGRAGLHGLPKHLPRPRVKAAAGGAGPVAWRAQGAPTGAAQAHMRSCTGAQLQPRRHRRRRGQRRHALLLLSPHTTYPGWLRSG